MFDKKKQQLCKMRTEIASLSRLIDDKNAEIECLRAQIREMQREANDAATNEDIAQKMRSKIADAIDCLHARSDPNCIYTLNTNYYSLSNVERLIVAYLAFINCTRAA